MNNQKDVDREIEEATSGDKPAWARDFDDAKVKKALAYGDIRPKLPLPEAGKPPIEITFIGEPEEVEHPNIPSQNHKGYFALVECGKMEYSMVIPTSMRFSLLKEIKKQTPPLMGVKGHVFLLSCRRDTVRGFKETNLYDAQFVK